MKLLARCVMIFLCGMGMARSAGETERGWTDVEGKQVNGTLLGVEGERVSLQIGKARSELPRQRFSAADQAYLETWCRGRSPLLQLPPPHWLGTISHPVPEVAGPEEKDGFFVFRTVHCEFVSDVAMAQSAIVEFAQVAEATWKMLQAHPLRPPVRAEGDRLIFRLAKDRAAYELAGGPKDTDGIFLNEFGGRGVMLVHLEALGIELKDGAYVKGRQFSPKVLIHEMGHQMMAEYIPFQPLWLREGVAESATLPIYRNGSFTQDRPTIIGQLKARVREYTRRDPEQGGAEVKENIPISQWLMPLADLLEVQGQLGSQSLVEKHRIYFTSLLVAWYYLYLEGDGEARQIRVYYQNLEQCCRYFRTRGTEGALPKGMTTTRDWRPACELLIQSLFGETTPDKIQTDVEKKFAAIGLRIEFPVRAGE